MNNQVGQDISFHTRDTETWRGIPAYASGNTSTNGVANYNDGTNVFLASDPDPQTLGVRTQRVPQPSREPKPKIKW